MPSKSKLSQPERLSAHTEIRLSVRGSLRIRPEAGLPPSWLSLCGRETIVTRRVLGTAHIPQESEYDIQRSREERARRQREGFHLKSLGREILVKNSIHSKREESR